jgi:YcaO-like protein with predicted kinase domain
MISIPAASSPQFLGRACSPAETVHRMRPHFARLGITRVAKQTGLDRLGIPAYASVRPNAALLSVNQGKGITDDAARASAVMEAVEFAVAEHFSPRTIRATALDLSDQGMSLEACVRLQAMGVPNAWDQKVDWVSAQSLRDGTPVMVPLDVLRLDGQPRDLPEVCHTTNGLASGNTMDEACFHALCELVERDGFSWWALSSPDERVKRCFDPALLEDDRVMQLFTAVEARGCTLKLFDQTTDIAVPVVGALIVDRQDRNALSDASAGYGAHLSPAEAALRAITEAAQTRVTSIASSRDDIAPESFSTVLGSDAEKLVCAEPSAAPDWRRPTVRSLAEAIHYIESRLEALGLSETIVVRLSSPDLPCVVVRLINPDLEDFEANAHWRPGRRALRWLGVK